jgi:hypothetical protein
MNKLFLAFLVTFVSGQTALWKTDIKQNQFNFLGWDYFGGKLIYYSNGTEYHCDALTKACKKNVINYTPTAYIITNTSYFYNDLEKLGSCKVDYASGKFICKFFKYVKYLKEFQSISVNTEFFYIRYPEENCLLVFDHLKFVNQTLPLLLKVPNLSTTWSVKQDGLYGIKVDTEVVKIVKYSLDGKFLWWTAVFPYCQTNNPKREMHISYSQSKLYVVCSPASLLTIYNTPDGSILDQYPLDNAGASAVECSESFVFILYGDGTVVQYTLDFNYVHTYSVENMKLPAFNALKADDTYLFSAICKNENGSDSCSIHQWSVQRNTTNIIVTSTTSVPLSPPSVKLENQTPWKRNSFVFEDLTDQKKIQNSYFTPVTYKDDGNQQHLFYFSGEGISGKGVCGDIFFHDMIIGSGNGNYTVEVFSMWRVGEVNNPLNNYAATLITDNVKYFYLIHGGVSCDYKTIYSDLFAIDIAYKQYIKVSHTNIIA